MTELQRKFLESIKLEACPPEFDVFLKALWFDGRDDWHSAHDLINDLTSAEAAWVHAYLHRKEGDLANADYWYKRAGRRQPKQSLPEEWNSLVEFFTNRIR